MRRLAWLALALGVTASAQNQDDAALRAARDRMIAQNDALFTEGDFPTIIENQKTLAELDPHDEQVWSDLGWMLGNVEKFDEELALAVRFKGLNEGRAVGPYYEAQFYFKRRTWSKVPPLLEPVVSDPALKPDANVFRFLANSYLRMGYVADAVRVWEAMLKIYPNDAQAKARVENLRQRLSGGQ